MEGERMELRVLRYFLAVAREGTISGAACALHVTQPTLSRQMMELEEELGKTLFLRGKQEFICGLEVDVRDLNLAGHELWQ